jgi:hypothetical protein
VTPEHDRDLPLMQMCGYLLKRLVFGAFDRKNKDELASWRQR